MTCPFVGYMYSSHRAHTLMINITLLNPLNIYPRAHTNTISYAASIRIPNPHKCSLIKEFAAVSLYSLVPLASLSLRALRTDGDIPDISRCEYLRAPLERQMKTGSAKWALALELPDLLRQLEHCGVPFRSV